MAFSLRQFFSDTQRTQGYALIELNLVANVDRLTNHHSGTVVNTESFTDPGTRMDIDTGNAVRVFGENSGNERHLKLKKFVRQPVYRDGVKSGVGSDNLSLTGRGGVAVKNSFGILEQHFIYKR